MYFMTIELDRKITRNALITVFVFALFFLYQLVINWMGSVVFILSVIGMLIMYGLVVPYLTTKWYNRKG